MQNEVGRRLAQIGDHRFKRLEIAMNIGSDSETHGPSATGYQAVSCTG